MFHIYIYIYIYIFFFFFFFFFTNFIFCSSYKRTDCDSHSFAGDMCALSALMSDVNSSVLWAETAAKAGNTDAERSVQEMMANMKAL